MTHSRLRRPTIINAAVPFLRPVQTRIYSRQAARLLPARIRGRTLLKKPAVIGAGRVFRPVQVHYFSGNNRAIRRKIGYYQPYVNENLHSATPAQPPVFVNVDGPRRK